jgi:hypothetical protein
MGKISINIYFFKDLFVFSKQSISTNDLNNQYTTHFDGQTPLSQIIASGPLPTIDSSSFLFDSYCTKRRKQSTMTSSSSKRGILPKSATSIMRSWLFQHIVNKTKILVFLKPCFLIFKGSSISN